MIVVHSPPEIGIEPQGGWELTFWVKPFNYETPFRAMLSEITEALGRDALNDLCLPPHEEHEDCVEGALQFGSERLRIYFEYSLGYLSLMSDDEATIRMVDQRIQSRVTVVPEELPHRSAE